MHMFPVHNDPEKPLSCLSEVWEERNTVESGGGFLLVAPVMIKRLINSVFTCFWLSDFFLAL